MRRERGCLEAVPVEQWDLRPPVSLLSVSETAVDTVYAKLLLADSFDVGFFVQYCLYITLFFVGFCFVL